MLVAGIVTEPFTLDNSGKKKAYPRVLTCLSRVARGTPPMKIGGVVGDTDSWCRVPVSFPFLSPAYSPNLNAVEVPSGGKPREPSPTTDSFGSCKISRKPRLEGSTDFKATRLQ